MENAKDFSNEIDDLVKALDEASDNGGLAYVGKVCGFDLYVEHRGILLTRLKERPDDLFFWNELYRFLQKNRYYNCSGIGALQASIMDDQREKTPFNYINVGIITARKEKMKEELTQLSKLLKKYQEEIISFRQ